MFKNKIGIVDLNRFKNYHLSITKDMQRLFLGGRGINMFLLYHLTSPSISPLSAENPLIIGAGLLTGMIGPATSRCSISGKSPETGLLGDSNIGGHFAAVLRGSGFAHLVIKGKAESPVYIVIENGSIEIKDATDLWGHDTIECMHYLENLYGDTCESLCIGQAGENLVRFSGVRHGLKNIAARTGMGCLMGSKKLKAIVVRADKADYSMKYPGEFMEYIKGLNYKLKSTRIREVLHTYGTPFLYDLHNRWGVIRTHNAQSTVFKNGKSLNSTNLKRGFYKRARGCFSCPIACRHVYEIDGVCGEGPEYGMLGAFGPICGIEDLEAIVYINDILNRYGMDCCSAGNIIAWVIELFQRKIITEADTHEQVLNWGDKEAIIELIHQIAHRKGFGALIADGAKVAAERIGRDSHRYLIWSKFLPQSDSVDVRAFKGFALGVATASRGADHLRSRPTIEALNLAKRDLMSLLNDADISTDPGSYKGKAKMVWWSEINYVLADAIGICRFAQKFNNIENLGIEEFSRLIFYATGMELTCDELFKIGERILTLERMFLQREGIDRRADTLPCRYFDEPIPSGRFKGEKIDRDSFDEMLDEYYGLHRWDEDTGTPGGEIIRELELDKRVDNLLKG